MIIEAVKSALPLRAYLAEHGAVFIRDKARCLFHEDRTPSASLYRGKDGYERLKCFGCGLDVDVIGAAQELHGLDFKGALKMLADRAGIKRGSTLAEKRALSAARKEREAKQALVAAFRKWERTTVNEIAEVLRAYRHMRATRTTFTEAELITLAELHGEIDILEYRYEILCHKDDESKIGLYAEVLRAYRHRR